MGLADSGYCFSIGHGNRLAAAGVVGDGEHDERDIFAADAGDQRLKRGDIHVAFEGQDGLGAAGFGIDEIDGLGARELDIGASGIEVGVVGDDVALLAHDVEEQALGGAALVRRKHVRVAGNVLDRALEAIEAGAAGVALIAFHDAGPLMCGHGAGAGVGEQIDEHVVGVEQEKVVVSSAQ